MQEEVKQEKRIGGGNQTADTKNQTGPCKLRATITPLVMLSDLSLQAHREHMENYEVICKFMGLWLAEKASNAWIKNH